MLYDQADYDYELSRWANSMAADIDEGNIPVLLMDWVMYKLTQIGMGYDQYKALIQQAAYSEGIPVEASGMAIDMAAMYNVSAIGESAITSFAKANKYLLSLKLPKANGTVKTGSLKIVQGGKYSESEINAANYMKDLGNDVTLRPPTGTRTNGGTSDLIVNGVNYDVYTPTTSNPDRIISAIAAKKDQAVGIVLDLSQTNVTAEQLGDIMARLIGKGVTTIKDVLIMK